MPEVRLTDQDRTDVRGVQFLGIDEIDSFTTFDGTTIGGLSGIAFDPVTGNYLAVSDDRGAGDDGTPRFYEITIDFSDGTLDDGDVTMVGVTALTLPDGSTLDVLNPDPEGIAIGASGQLYISSERNGDGRIPQIFTVTLGGVVSGELAVDGKFKGLSDGTGVRNNLGFESLTITPNQTTLYTATESALSQDGPSSTTDNGSAARIIQYDLASGEAVAEFVYEVDPIASEPVPAGAFADSGLVELLALDNQGTLLALERSFSVGAPDRGYTGKLYLVRTQQATNVIDQESIPGTIEDGELEINVDEVVQKELLADLGDFGIVVDNIEGMTLGPVLPDGRQSLIIVSDDNFSAFGPQANQFITLALDLETIPTIKPTLQTPDELRYDDPSDTTEGPDPDDPAIWVHPRNESKSTVVTAMKNGGLRVYDLEGNEIQSIEPDGIRYNNVDILYDVKLGRRELDLAIASDRQNDTLAIFKIKKNGTLKDITSKAIPDTIFGVDDGEATAYGLASYQSPIDGQSYVFVTQADGAQIAQLQLTSHGRKVSFETVRMLQLPVPTDEDPEDFQSEGITIDRETGIGYVTVEEELGLLSFEAELGGSNAFKVVAPIDSDVFEPDLEGVSIFYGDDGEGLILVSSQGDSTFAVFDRVSHAFLGSFAIRENGSIDGVEESDGLEIYSGSLPGFESGLLVTQDGSNEPQVVFGDPDDGEIQNFNVNFKYTDFAQVLELFGREANPDYDPRDIEAQTLPNGVAAGDVTENSVVLWARSLAPGKITFMVFEKGKYWWPAAWKKAEVTDSDVPVKVEIEHLDPGKEYIYKVIDAAGAYEVGTFKTAHEDGFHGLTFGVSGDWRGELAPYPAVSNADEADLDFFLLGGDNIYADFPSPALDQPQAITTDDFRAKYGEVYGIRGGENFFADLFKSTAVYATIDDHEVTNDFAGGGTIGDTAESEFRELFPGDDPAAFVNDATLYENGLQAWQDYHAISDEFYGDTGDDLTAGERKLYRNQEFGQDAAIFVLDQRSFRDEQIETAIGATDPADIARFNIESFDPTRTMLGAAQLNDLLADLVAAEENGVTWKFIYSPEPFQELGFGNADSWEGYKAERTEILKFIDENDIDNVVFVAADIHATFVNNLTYAEDAFGELSGQQIATSAFEITTGSVAFDQPFGPTIVEGAVAVGALSPKEFAFYQSLPVAPDNDRIANDKDGFITQVFNDRTLAPFGRDPLGLDNNLPQADGLIDSELLQGGWVSAHTYGWTEFDIDSETQALTVTTYGIDAYTKEQVEKDPSSIVDLEPRIVSQFVVNPEIDTPPVNVIEATPRRETHFGTDEKDVFVFEPGDSTLFRCDKVFDFEENDLIDVSAFGFTSVEINRGLWGPDEDALSVVEIGRKVVLVGGDDSDALFLKVDGDIDDVTNGLIVDPGSLWV